MDFEIEIRGRTRRVTVEPKQMSGPEAGRVDVHVDGVTHEVDVRRVVDGLSLLFGNGRSMTVAVTEQAPGRWLAQLPHVAVTAVVNGRGSDRPEDREDGTPDRDVRVTAPMPGRVVRVLVEPGDEVQARQGLVVVEAMKMENELTAPRAGRVAEVAVAPGTPVEAGRLLVLLT